jgi:acyl-CoA synthetase (AMP-forming)/AMP-acid ligase II
MYDIARFAGAQVLMQALVTGAPLVLPDPHAALPDRLLFLAENGVNALSATPTLWRKILMSPQSARLSLRQITLGGEIVEDGILAALAQRFPAARIVHIYASTEAGAAFSVADGRAGFPVAYLREPPKGIELKIQGGQLLVRTDRANAAYVGSGGVFADADGFVDTGDAVEVRGDRCIFLGRANGMINVGGNKLFPEEVERVLMAHPSVRMARVSGKKSPMTGQLVMAEIVLADDVRDHSQASALLLSHCRAHLAPWKTPALMRIVADLAPNAAGKLGRGAA